MTQTKVLHAVLICLLIFAIFNYAVVTLRPLIQKDNELTPEGKTALHPLNVPLKERPPVLIRGDPVEDPIPVSESR